MPTSKSAASATKKWRDRTAVAGEDYKTGVQTTTKDWAALTAASENNWKTAITNAAAKGSFGKGVSAAGTAKWKAGASVKGADRFAPGVAASSDIYQRKMGEVIATIESVPLPPRYPKGDARNLKRVEAIMVALHRKKTG